jgi:hypothetical protein
MHLFLVELLLDISNDHQSCWINPDQIDCSYLRDCTVPDAVSGQDLVVPPGQCTDRASHTLTTRLQCDESDEHPFFGVHRHRSW